MAQADPTDPSGPALGHRVVKPNDVEILADKGRNQLTLMACNPKYYATQRIVVEALLVGNPVAGKPVTHVSNVNQDALAGLNKGDNPSGCRPRCVAVGRAGGLVPDLVRVAPAQAAPGPRRGGRSRRLVYAPGV